jgi:hypothetical protein
VSAGRALLQALGPPGIAGIGLLLACLPFYYSAIRPTEQALATWRLAAETPRPRAARGAAPGRAEQLRRFYGLFPPLAQLPDELGRLYAFARDAHLDLPRGDYRLEDDGSPLAAYRVTLPLRGSYAEIRQFIGQVLRAMPVASIDSLQFERTSAQASAVSAQVQLTVFFRAEGGAAQ